MLWWSEVVKVLMEHGADVNTARKDSGQTALMWASQLGHLNVVQLLVSSAAISAADEQDLNMALLIASQKVILCTPLLLEQVRCMFTDSFPQVFLISSCMCMLLNNRHYSTCMCVSSDPF